MHRHQREMRQPARTCRRNPWRSKALCAKKASTRRCTTQAAADRRHNSQELRERWRLKALARMDCALLRRHASSKRFSARTSSGLPTTTNSNAPGIGSAPAAHSRGELRVWMSGRGGGSSTMRTQSGSHPSGPEAPSSNKSIIRVAIRSKIEESHAVRASQAGLRFTSSNQGRRSSLIRKSKPYISKHCERCTMLGCAAFKEWTMMSLSLGTRTSSQYMFCPVISESAARSSPRLATPPSATCWPCLFTAQFEMWRCLLSRSSKS
mmetsp:Transcript_27054/g.89844  ORF Transcript_27054/g.89844 Transcript_27054/m.89844 type:complete len:265 (-) Transcript_27054:2009-2803(-)